MNRRAASITTIGAAFTTETGVLQMTIEMFRCHDARLHTLPDAPTLKAATHEQLVDHYRRLKQLNANAIVPRFGTRADDDEGFFESACHGVLAEEDYWRQCDLTWAWIDEHPVWLSPIDWFLDVLPNPPAPMCRRFRLSLAGGGQVTVIEHFKIWNLTPTDTAELYCYQQDLRVTADVGEGLQRFTGAIDRVCFEMGAAAVLFRPGTPQTVADRVAATFRLLNRADPDAPDVRGPDPENFAALLDRGLRCCVCDRPLRDHVSTLLGIGPNCARQLQLSHSLEAANQILRRRKELLGSDAP